MFDYKFRTNVSLRIIISMYPIRLYTHCLLSTGAQCCFVPKTAIPIQYPIALYCNTIRLVLFIIGTGTQCCFVPFRLVWNIIFHVQQLFICCQKFKQIIIRHFDNLSSPFVLSTPYKRNLSKTKVNYTYLRSGNS